MRFVKTHRFSPVIEMGDLPWEYDLYHYKPETLPETKKALDEFIAKNNVEADIQWWYNQKDRCINGYEIEDSVEKGGDVFLDGWDVIWNDTAKGMEYSKDVIIPPESCYMPEYDTMIRNNKLRISGRMYWYLNFWIIFGLSKHGTIKRQIPPRFLDIDFGLFQRVDCMMKRASGHLQETKTRQKGVTHKMASLLGYSFTWLPGSQNIVAGGMSDDAINTFNNVVIGLDNLRNTQFYRQRSKNDLTGYHIRGRYSGSFFMAISCKDNAQAISRFSPSLIVYEEAGKWAKGLLSQAREFVDVSLKAEGKQTGFGIVLGTGGDMDMGAADLEKMHYHPQDYNLLRFKNKWEREPVNDYTAHFIPGWQYKIIDEDGNSLKRESLAYMEKEELAAKNKSDKEYYVYQTQNANYAADAFRISGGLFFGTSIANFCNERKAFIMTHREAQRVKRGWFRWKNGIRRWADGVVWEEDINGPFVVSELPRTFRENNKDIVYKNLYKAATDSYDQDEAKTSTSKGSCWIKKGFLNSNESYDKYVAGVLVRPEISEGGRDTFYEYTVLLCVAYDAINLIEHKNLLIFEWYHRNGFTMFLKERPGMLISKYVKNSQATNVYGIDGAFKPHSLKILKDKLSDRMAIENIDFLEILEAIVKFRLHKDYNCDITISLAYLETLMEDEINVKVLQSKEEPIRAPSYRMINGEIVLT